MARPAAPTGQVACALAEAGGTVRGDRLPARQALDACRQIGLRVPQQVAVIGVDNEEVICAHVQPQLTSVARNNQQEGYHAAAMLDQLIRGKQVAAPRK